MLKIRIRQHEIGLCFRHGDLRRVLEPGAYFVPARLIGWDRVEVVDKLTSRFQHALLDVLVKNAELQKHLDVVDLTNDERAFVWKDGRLDSVLGPGRYAFWKGLAKIEVEVVRVDEPIFEHARMEAILAHPDAKLYLQAVHIEPRERVLLFQEGRLIDTVDEGLAVFWKLVAPVTWKAVDLRELVAEVTGQEIMTADKVSVRLSLLVTYQVVDAVAAVTLVEDYEQALYREAQLALRAAVGTRPLDRLLSDKEAVGTEVLEAIRARADAFGLAVKAVGLRDVILPGDMKTILNQVIEAQKQAEANLIRRREETAAARSQANTARLLTENPALARMKELEALQEILQGTKATFLLGRGDLVQQIRSLAGADENGAGEEK